MPTTARRQSRKNKQAELKKEQLKELSMFDRAAKGLFSVLDVGYTDRQVLDAKGTKFRNILNRELDLSKGYSKGSIVDFVSSLNLNQDQKMRNTKAPDKDPGINDVFTKNINDIFTYFQDIYRNKYIEMTDLKFVARFIPALGEAVKTILDAVVSADDIAETINRKLELPKGIPEEDRIAITREAERIEDELKLLKKLKNIVYRKTLVVGTHYVYRVSYNRLFEEYDMIKKRDHGMYAANAPFNSPDKSGNYVDKFNTHVGSYGTSPVSKIGSARESYTIGDIDITPAMENVRDILTSAPLKKGKGHMDQNTANSTMETFRESLPEITFFDSECYQEAIESVQILSESSFAMEAFQRKQTGRNRNEEWKHNPLELTTSDGTVGLDHKPRPSKFNIPGTYIKYLDPKNIIPLRVFDQTIGYYLIHPKAKKNKSSAAGEVTGINSIGNTLFSAVNIGEAKKHDAISRIVDSISEGILRKFDKKFATKNAEYKKLIADVIIANGLTDKDYNIQFIPASDVTKFTIQENEEGFGESVLSDSLFPAKLLMSMIVTRMLNYINKTGNKTIAHIHRGPINSHDHNQIQQVIRDIQDADVTFNDLLSPNLVFNKFNRDGNMVIPTSRNDARLVEFEVQEGQNIDMTPEYEKELENMAILGTGVPSVIMEYAQSADFAKQIVSAHIKFAGRIATLQGDLEEATTELYKELLRNSNLTDEQKTIVEQSLEFKLPRPKALKNSNSSEFMQTEYSNAELIADTLLGRETIQDQEKMPNGQRIKDLLIQAIIKDDTPFLDWDELEQIRDEVIIRVNEEEKDRPENPEGGIGESGGMPGGF